MNTTSERWSSLVRGAHERAYCEEVMRPIAVRKKADAEAFEVLMQFLKEMTKDTAGNVNAVIAEAQDQES